MIENFGRRQGDENPAKGSDIKDKKIVKRKKFYLNKDGDYIPNTTRGTQEDIDITELMQEEMNRGVGNNQTIRDLTRRKIIKG